MTSWGVQIMMKHCGEFSPFCHCDPDSPSLLFPLPLTGGEGKGEGEVPPLLEK